MSSDLLNKGYEPHDVEKRWYEFWEKNNLFAASDRSDRKAFSIVIPPPNVTGVLHMGHALNHTMQDILCRYRRLRGDNVLWMPGTDHAGIATQNVVEKKLAKDGISRHEMGREKFIEAVWQWREKYGNAIINQLKRLGASCDWGRERFTMDEGLSLAVRKVFVQLFHEGLIYQGDYIINWCCRCQTALADLEVEHEEVDGRLYHINYPFENGSDGVVIATTRPETMLGDTAVSVHPDDERYENARGKNVVLPLMKRPIPVITDPYVDKSFGTGALKITPAHDPNDFEIGERHHLESVKVIGDDGIMTEASGEFAGMDRFECRKAVVEELKKQGLLKQVEAYKHGVGHCYRCKSVIEPNLSKQWFVKTGPLAEKAIEAVKNGKTKIIPETWLNTYYEWMNNIRDWCISRQIWWGHQIPAWTCESCGEMVVVMDSPETCHSCGDKKLTQDTDVLDTWFSSALWPFSTMGWPEETPLLKTFYPTTVLVTAFDILFFWVARMMMMGIHFMGDIPFRAVYIHALVRDEEGKKMSKSIGNVIDPLTIIDEYGTDAFRFTLAAFAAQGRDIKMSEKRVEGYRHFINKLWNAARFALMHVNKGYDKIDGAHLSLPDKWILSRLHRVAQEVSSALDHYRFNEAAGSVYRFVWHEFCDWYLEAVKPVLYGKGVGEEKPASTLSVLWWVLRDTLVISHPFIPFVTEEIWDKLPGTDGSIMRAVFPQGDDSASAGIDEAAESKMQLITTVITGVRNIRGEMNLAPSLLLQASVQSDSDSIRDTVKEYEDLIMNLARLDSFTVKKIGSKPSSSATAVPDGMMVYVSLKGVIEFKKESQRLEKEIDKLTAELAPIEKKLSNDNFLSKAPEEVVNKVRKKKKSFVEKREKLQSTLSKIESMKE